MKAYTYKTNAEFLANIKRNSDGLHAVPACSEECEGWFAWSSCDLCDSQFGGERHPGALIKPGSEQEPIELSICVDCLCYLANGDLPHADNTHVEAGSPYLNKPLRTEEQARRDTSPKE